LRQDRSALNSTVSIAAGFTVAGMSAIATARLPFLF
jgi:hypothetical protein